MSRIIKGLLVFLVLALLLVGGIGVKAYRFLNTPASEQKELVVFEVQPRKSFKSIARRLQSEGLVDDAFKFEWYGRLTGQSAKVRTGEYAIPRNVTPQELMSIITSGRSVEYVFTVTEGLNIFEIAELVARQGLATQQDFLKLIRDKDFVREILGEELPSLEGYLFPETYKITKFTTVKGLVRMMVDRYKAKYAELEQDSNWNSLKMSRHELTTLASIIEKETGAPEERPVISSVFHNRLRMKMRLQTDPTVIYGVWEETGTWNRNISRNDLLTPNHYNTYTFAGLPFGPIANPGFEALKAAGLPQDTKFLYFVSRNDGTHIFSETYSQHQSAVAAFQKDRRAREGKSWRDLQKREQATGKVIDSPSVPALKPSSKKN